PESDYRYLDFGFDFYAAQFAANVGDPDKAILIAWIGLPDNHYCTEPEDWEGSMCLPRELRIKDGHIVQAPVAEIASLRDGEVEANGNLPDFCEMEVANAGGDFFLNLYTKADGTGGVTMKYDDATKILTVDKTGMDNRFNENVGEVLEVPLERPLENIRIFIDRCSFELFINDGDATFTSHIYPTADEHHYTISDNGSVKIYALKASVTDEFVI
ncbi:MAG: GH32 C-terminal domain-containing protein, partial [Lachnospiraceae bacterium]|nr:GH32 C-terminal domain-containing protein [Lachnospiraceae bacterium]